MKLTRSTILVALAILVGALTTGTAVASGRPANGPKVVKPAGATRLAVGNAHQGKRIVLHPEQLHPDQVITAANSGEGTSNLTITQVVKTETNASFSLIREVSRWNHQFLQRRERLLP